MGRKLLDLLLARRGFGVSLIGFGLAMVLLAFKPGDVADIGPSWFDIMNQVWQRDRISEPVVIVAIDEASIAEFGAWPWPRVQTAKLLERIAAGRPAAVGIDIFFSEVEGGSPAALAKRPGVPEDIRQWLLKQPSGDDVLAAGLATGPFIMAVGGTGEPASGPPEGMISQVIHLGEDPRAALARWRPAFAPLRSKPKFRDASEGEGVIALSTGFDGVARQTGQVFDIGGDVLAPGLAIEMLRMASGANHIVADADEDGVHRLTLLAGQDPVLQIDTEPNGTVRPWFGDRAIDREIPAIALLTDDNELARIEGKLVLVGYTAAGGLDEWLTPIEQVVPGVDIHRQTLEGIFDNRLLVRPDWAENAEFVLAIVLAFIGAFVPIRLRLGGGVALGVSLLIFPMAGALAVYMIGLITLDGATPMLIAFIAGGPSFAAHITLSERERRRSESVQSRIDGEMAAAKRMQMGILPNAVDVFPDEKRFSIAAISEPARTVGGDLYDFFLLDDRRLFFIVGDVAGKGPEASLFMAIAKYLCKFNALCG
ncbi:MAG: CHASE2 domain-containing protein, partial [Alphaproteobacteria bacterium]